MNSVLVSPECVVDAPFHPQLHPLDFAQPIDDLAATISTLIEDHALEARFDANADAFDALSTELDDILDAAFERDELWALTQAHAVLFALYELHVAPAASERCANQFNP